MNKKLLIILTVVLVMAFAVPAFANLTGLGGVKGQSPAADTEFFYNPEACQQACGVNSALCAQEGCNQADCPNAGICNTWADCGSGGCNKTAQQGCGGGGCGAYTSAASNEN